VEGITPERYVEYLRAHLPALSHAPISFISAKTGFNVQETIELAFSLHEEWKTRISTGPLNAAVQELLQRRSPRPVKNRIAKIYYATQVSVAPPTIVMFANDPSLFSRSYLRYLEHGLRDAFPFSEVPLKLIVRQRKSTQTSSTSI